MTASLLWTLAATGFGFAFIHASLPTHWLPFALAARAQGWGRARALWVTALAGCGHLGMTALLGFAAAWLGLEVNHALGHWFPAAAAAVLAGFGGYYLWRGYRGRADGHRRLSVAATQASGDRRSDRAVIAGLFTMLMLSPSEVFIPVYVAGARYGWGGFAVLTAVLTVATLTAMLLFTALALRGLQALRVRWIERNESTLLGGALLLLAILVLVLE